LLTISSSPRNQPAPFPSFLSSHLARFKSHQPTMPPPLLSSEPALTHSPNILRTHCATGAPLYTRWTGARASAILAIWLHSGVCVRAVVWTVVLAAWEVYVLLLLPYFPEAERRKGLSTMRGVGLIQVGTTLGGPAGIRVLAPFEAQPQSHFTPKPTRYKDLFLVSKHTPKPLPIPPQIESRSPTHAIAPNDMKIQSAGCKLKSTGRGPKGGVWGYETDVDDTAVWDVWGDETWNGG
ncbi:hypothetical protein DFP72DRAFT_1123615, partial [Ephemerocybe angulata]